MDDITINFSESIVPNISILLILLENIAIYESCIPFLRDFKNMAKMYVSTNIQSLTGQE